MTKRVLSICTGMGLMDRAFLDAGYEVVAGCEIDPAKRSMYKALCGTEPLVHDLKDLPDAVAGQVFDGVIGGPPCQAKSRTRAMRKPKYPDLTPLVMRLLAKVRWEWFLFENVRPIELGGAYKATQCDAMHYYQPHQSRPRWFTHSPNISRPLPVYKGDVDDLLAYCAVAGRIYGPKRGARIQGYPAAADLPASCLDLQHGLADAVPYPLAAAWANAIQNGERFSY